MAVPAEVVPADFDDAGSDANLLMLVAAGKFGVVESKFAVHAEPKASLLQSSSYINYT